jgi:D-alanyl-D-alanine dipeptidase
MLSTHAQGPTSFDDMYTMSGVVNPTFQSACLALGLLGDDQEWWHYLGQAAHF